MEAGGGLRFPPLFGLGQVEAQPVGDHQQLDGPARNHVSECHILAAYRQRDFLPSLKVGTQDKQAARIKG